MLKSETSVVRPGAAERSSQGAERVTWFSWLGDLNLRERRTLRACLGGWTLDAFDVMMYSFVIGTLMTLWHMSKAEAGVAASAGLLASCVGGIAAGVLCDRFGRVRVLRLMILWFSFTTFATAFCHGPGQLIVARILQGLGFGGEWACGAVLMSEVIRARYRGRALAAVQMGQPIGWGMAALLYWAVYALVSPEWAWRVMFMIGVLPALLVFYLRNDLSEQQHIVDQTGPQTPFWSAFRGPVITRAILAALLASGIQGNFYTIAIWLPTFLKQQHHLSVFGTSAHTLTIIVGSLIGMWCSGFICDAMGRRKALAAGAILSVVISYSYMVIPIDNTLMLWLGIPMGFALAMCYGPMGSFLSELFPTRIRGTAQGTTYNAGRAIGAVMPAAVGVMSASMSLGVAIAVMAVASNVVILFALALLPETRNTELPDDPAVL